MYLLIFIAVLSVVPFGASGTNSTAFTVGTVLFSPSDAAKECWNQENLALLTTRMLMANLMPHADKIKATDDNFVTDIIDYFRLLLEVIRSNSSGKTKHIMLLAVTDTMGGYMKHLVLPVCKYAYYAGNIQYSSIIHLYQLYDELKNYLRTNGEGWAKPWKKAGRHVQAKAISVQAPSPTSDPCKGIIYSKHTSTNSERAKEARDSANVKTCSMEVPLPFFDSKTHPAAIAVPFRTFGLRNLEARVSAYILVKYFVAVSKCMSARNTNDEDVQKFNTNIFSFIVAKVMPHLGDEKFYAAFGGVLRILQTVSETTKAKGQAVIGNINIMPESDREPPDMLEEEEDEETKNRSKSNDDRSRNNLILLAALATIIIWFCLGAAFVCCRIKAGRMRNDKALEDDENACREGTCPALYEPSSATGTDNETNETTKVLYSVNQTKMQTKSSKASKKSSKTTKSSKSTASHNTNSNTTEFDSDSQSRSQVSQSQGSHSLSNTAPTTGSIGSRQGKRKDSSMDRSRERERDRDKNREREQPQRSSAASGGKGQTPASAPQIQVHSVQYYPPSFACHTSMTGRVKIDSSTDEYTSRDDTKRPYVFGYDFQTTSEESSPREPTTDGENEMNGNMSK